MKHVAGSAPSVMIMNLLKMNLRAQIVVVAGKAPLFNENSQRKH